MALNLSRNTKVYFTTNVNAITGIMSDLATGYTSINTFEIAVLDGYSFTQGTSNQMIQVNEAGPTPVRGERSFNTAVNPVDWSFTSYVRPNRATVGGVLQVAPQERFLWNALMGAAVIDTVGASLSAASTVVRASTLTPVATAAVTATAAFAVGDVINIGGITSAGAADFNSAGIVQTLTPNATAATSIVFEYLSSPGTAAGTTVTGATAKAYAGQWGVDTTNVGYVSSGGSNKQQLQKFGLIFVVDGAVYLLDNCAINQASIDFGLDAITQVAWSGQSTALRQAGTLTGAILAASALANPTTANFITNKLSTTTVQGGIDGNGTTYTIPITGGNITINNNIQYLTPASLGVVNTPIGYFTGTRAITGNLSAYLRTGNTGVTADAGQLLKDILTNISTATEPKYKIQVEVGGITNTNRLEFEMAGVSLQVPAVNVADVVATTINFTAQGFDPLISNQAFDLTRTNDLVARYYSS